MYILFVDVLSFWSWFCLRSAQFLSSLYCVYSNVAVYAQKNFENQFQNCFTCLGQTVAEKMWLAALQQLQSFIRSTLHSVHSYERGIADLCVACYLWLTGVWLYCMCGLVGYQYMCGLYDWQVVSVCVICVIDRWLSICMVCMIDRWLKMVTSSLRNVSWWHCSRHLTTAASLTTLERWWVLMRFWCAPSRSAL